MGVEQLETVGMEEISNISWHWNLAMLRNVRADWESACYVEGIAKQGVASGGQVNADLMGAAGADGDFHKGGGWGSLEDLHLTVGWATCGRSCVNITQHWMGDFADGGCDCEAVGQVPWDD
jgi:hypothetical protein